MSSTQAVRSEMLELLRDLIKRPAMWWTHPMAAEAAILTLIAAIIASESSFVNAWKAVLAERGRLTVNVHVANNEIALLYMGADTPDDAASFKLLSERADQLARAMVPGW